MASAAVGWPQHPSTDLSPSCCPTSSGLPGTVTSHSPGSRLIPSLSSPCSLVSTHITHLVTGLREPDLVGSLLFFHYLSSASLVPSAVLSPVRLLSDSKSPTEYYYTHLANEETKLQKQDDPMSRGSAALHRFLKNRLKSKDYRPEESTTYVDSCLSTSRVAHQMSQIGAKAKL